MSDAAIAYFAGDFMKSRQRTLFPKVLSDLTERGVWVAFKEASEAAKELSWKAQVRLGGR